MRILSFVTIISLFFSFIPAIATAYNQNSAAGYLTEQPASEWSVMALSAIGKLNKTNTEFLNSPPANNSLDIEKRLLARYSARLSKNGLIEKLSQHFSQGEIDPGAELLNDDIFALLALSAYNEKSNIQTELKKFIKQNQNSDGGWGFTHSPTDSDSNDTAMAIMALISAGENPSSETIKSGFDYIAQNKKDSGGYSYSPDFTADSASTSWIVSALYSAGKTPDSKTVEFLKNHQNTNGSFSWQTGQDGSALMTAYAIIALSGSSYPVQPAEQPDREPEFGLAVIDQQKNTLTVEQQSFTDFFITDENGKKHSFTSPKAIGTLAQTTLDSVISDSSFGLFVKSIAGIEPQGQSGWMYAVNNTKPNVGAADYDLQNGDQVIWFYDNFNADPPPFPDTNENSAFVELEVKIEDSSVQLPEIQLKTSKTNIQIGDEVTLSWDIKNADNIKSKPNNWTGNKMTGSYTVQPAETTVYSITASRSGREVTETVKIQVNTDPQLVFGVNRSKVDFAKLSKGQTSNPQKLFLFNNGQTDLNIKTELKNQTPVYDQGLLINNTKYNKFSPNLPAKSALETELVLEVPKNLNSSGIQKDVLIFTAKPR